MNWADQTTGALLGVLFTYIIPFSYRRIRLSVTLPVIKRFWGFLQEPTHIFLSVTGQDNGFGTFGAYGDMLAAAKILVAANDYFGANQNITIHDKYDDYKSACKNNMIILGGGKYNLAYRDIIQQINPPLHYFDSDGTEAVADRKKIKNKQDSVVYAPEYDSENKLQSDLGLIIRAKNPHDKSKQVVIAAGSHTWGTLAAIDFLLDPGSVRIFKKHLDQNLELAIRAQVAGNVIKNIHRLSEVLTW